MQINRACIQSVDKYRPSITKDSVVVFLRSCTACRSSEQCDRMVPVIVSSFRANSENTMIEIRDSALRLHTHPYSNRAF